MDRRHHWRLDRGSSLSCRKESAFAVERAMTCWSVPNGRELRATGDVLVLICTNSWAHEHSCQEEPWWSRGEIRRNSTTVPYSFQNSFVILQLVEIFKGNSAWNPVARCLMESHTYHLYSFKFEKQGFFGHFWGPGAGMFSVGCRIRSVHNLCQPGVFRTRITGCSHWWIVLCSCHFWVRM